MNDFLSYLHYGYLPTRQGSLEDLGIGTDKPFPRASNASTYEELVAKGVAALRAALTPPVARESARKHVLPLSGGLDSRAILGGLLEHAAPEQITAVTFGTPGTRDYDIGRLVAKAAGIRSECIDLTAREWRWDGNAVLDFAKNSPAPTWIFEAFVNASIPRRFGTGHAYWSGFMGDPLAGSHLVLPYSASWEEAGKRFIRKNRFSKTVSLTPPDFDPVSVLPAAPLCSADQLTYDEQLDFAIRQNCLIRSLVLPAGFAYETPFLRSEWVDFILSVPRSHRLQERLYHDVLIALYPDLFSLPVKTLGIPLTASPLRQKIRRFQLRLVDKVRRTLSFLPAGINPMINYVDFAETLRRREDFRTLVGDAIQDLRRRNRIDWLDMEAMWSSHQSGAANHAHALLGLAATEFYLKAGKLED